MVGEAILGGLFGFVVVWAVVRLIQGRNDDGGEGFVGTTGDSDNSSCGEAGDGGGGDGGGGGD
jgi:hypothetical protein